LEDREENGRIREEHEDEICGFHGGKNIDVVLLGCNTVWTCR
jgi:hypothetical protein